MVEDLKRLGRITWAEEEFQLLELVEMPLPKKLSALDVKGSRTSHSRAAGISAAAPSRPRRGGRRKRTGRPSRSSPIRFFSRGSRSRRKAGATSSRRRVPPGDPSPSWRLKSSTPSKGPLAPGEILAAPASEKKSLSGDQKNLLKKTQKGPRRPSRSPSDCLRA